MKKYLFGLGAMLVGAGLMFVLMHGGVSAEVFDDKMDDKKGGLDILGGMTPVEYDLWLKMLPSGFHCSSSGYKYKSDMELRSGGRKSHPFPIHHCKTKNMSCALFLGKTGSNLSCVKT